MAPYFLSNHTQVGGTVHWAGSLVADEVGDPIAELRSAGAALLPAEEPAIAVAAARATAKRLKGASEGDLTAMMLAAQAALPGRTQLIYRPGGPTAGPFFANFGELFVVAGGSEVFLFEGSGVQNPDGTGPAIEMASGAELAIILLPGSDLGAGTLAGQADSTINLI